MALNFPASPAPGQVFTSEGATFIWNGVVWLAQSPAVIPWATPAEALAGVVADKAMSPLTTKALRDQLLTANLATGPALTTDFVNILAVPFTAEFTRMQVSAAAGLTHNSSATGADVIAELRLRDTVAGADVATVVGGATVSSLQAMGSRFPLDMTYTQLIVGRAYEVQFWARRFQTGATITTPRELSINGRVFP